MDNKNIIKKSIEMEIAIYALDNQYAKRDNDVLSIYHTERGKQKTLSMKMKQMISNTTRISPYVNLYCV